MSAVVGVLPGNGHVDARLDRARRAAARVGADLELVSLDHDTSVASFDELLADLEPRARAVDLVYATGIGGLVHLALLAGGMPPRRAVLQGPVLWGLESRRFPRLMRLPLMPRALVLALRTGWVRRRFERRHFQAPLDPELRRAFFDGYRDPRAFARWFAWLTPGLLRSLEPRLRGRRELLEGLEVWWGSEDHVVGVEELRITERALDLDFHVQVREGWGHYPMIDDPEGWVRAVAAAVEGRGALAATP